jgi:hypothetical protein
MKNLLVKSSTCTSMPVKYLLCRCAYFRLLSEIPRRQHNACSAGSDEPVLTAVVSTVRLFVNFLVPPQECLEIFLRFTTHNHNNRLIQYYVCSTLDIAYSNRKKKEKKKAMIKGIW